VLRSASALDAGEGRVLNAFFDDRKADTALWVAEHAVTTVVGAAYAEMITDYFTQERHGHLGILMVAQEAEGRGVGRRLLETVERWAHEQGSRFLTLNVFARNGNAFAFYERSGFQSDFMRMIKPLRPP
jgi:GNAT superfamily N-acetyltransferase